MNINLDDFNGIVSCEIKNAKLEIDCTGIIRENLEVQDNKVTFDEGIKSLKNYLFKKKENSEYKDDQLFKNTFKAPIIYKSFIGK